MSQDYVIGTFVREEKNRFICTVNIDGIDEECYIPSSCRLENFLELAGKKVILHENMNKSARTRYAVYAIRFKRNYIVLRTAEANDIIRNNITNRRFAFLGKRKIVERECNIEGYKTDLYLPETKTIVEIKSIIATTDEAVFPTVYSERAIEQLEKIKILLKNGYKVVYIYVSLNPYVKRASISKEDHSTKYAELMKECLMQGMICKAYSSEVKNGEPVIKKEIELVE